MQFPSKYCFYLLTCSCCGAAERGLHQSDELRAAARTLARPGAVRRHPRPARTLATFAWGAGEAGQSALPLRRCYLPAEQPLPQGDVSRGGGGGCTTQQERTGLHFHGRGSTNTRSARLFSGLERPCSSNAPGRGQLQQRAHHTTPHHTTPHHMATSMVDTQPQPRPQ